MADLIKIVFFESTYRKCDGILAEGRFHKNITSQSVRGEINKVSVKISEFFIVLVETITQLKSK